MDDFARWLEPARWTVPLVLLAGAAPVALWARIRLGLSLHETVWLGLSLASIWIATVPERRLAPIVGRAPLDTLQGCVMGVGRYLPESVSDLAQDVVPNVLLYAGLGFILALAGVSRRVTLLTAGSMSAATELYQALFTHGVCAPRDVAANLAGALAGSLLPALAAHARPGRGSRGQACPELPVRERRPGARARGARPARPRGR